MNIKKALTHPFINQSELAKRIYPNAKYPSKMLNRKVNGIEGRKLSKDDEALIEGALREFWKEITIE